MKGADKYYDIFDGRSQQIGRFYLQFSKHARGKCFEMLLLPDGVKQGDPGWSNDSVEIYGVTGGQRGWTESYGWLHRGKWEEDFLKIVEDRKIEKARALSIREDAKASQEIEGRNRVNRLLSDYP